MAIKVSVESELEVLPRGVALLCKKIITNALKYLTIDNVALTVVFTSDKAIAKINSTYRNKQGPTDVISFAYRESPMPKVSTIVEHVGDIYISIEMAQRQAQEYNVPLNEELARLIIHGLLHLFGYDHEKSEYQRKKMQKKEKEIYSIVTTS